MTAAGAAGIGEEIRAFDRGEQVAEPRVGAALVQQPGDSASCSLRFSTPPGGMYVSSSHSSSASIVVRSVSSRTRRMSSS